MMLKKSLNVLFVGFVIIVFVSGYLTKIKASDFDNHHDWDDYCMRAQNVKITKTEFYQWENEGILHQMIANKSEIVVKKFEPNIDYEKLSYYQGTIYFDFSNLTDIDLSQDIIYTSGIFYLDVKDKNKNYLKINIIIQDGESNLGGDIEGKKLSDNPIKKVDLPLSIGENMVKKDVKGFINWLFSGEEYSVILPFFNIAIILTPLSMMNFSLSILFIGISFFLLLNDFRFYRDYRKKVKEFICSKYR